MQATKIDQAPDGSLSVQWDDGHHSSYTLQLLRDECPCAGCKGEVLFGKVYMPSKLPLYSPGMYELAGLKAVGQYGVQAAWKDGHDTGIYSWEYLRAICPCAQCAEARKLAET